MCIMYVVLTFLVGRELQCINQSSLVAQFQFQPAGRFRMEIWKYAFNMKLVVYLNRSILSASKYVLSVVVSLSIRAQQRVVLLQSRQQAVS